MPLLYNNTHIYVEFYVSYLCNSSLSLRSGRYFLLNNIVLHGLDIITDHIIKSNTLGLIMKSTPVHMISDKAQTFEIIAVANQRLLHQIRKHEYEVVFIWLTIFGLTATWKVESSSSR